MPSAIDLYLRWRREPVGRSAGFEDALQEFWRTGDANKLTGHALPPATIAALKTAWSVAGAENSAPADARRRLLHHAFQALPDPVLIVAPAGILPNPALEKLLVDEEGYQLRFPLGARIAILAPIRKLLENTSRIHRHAFVLPIGTRAFATQSLRLPELRATVLYFLPLPVRLSEALAPEVRLHAMLRLSGLRAKEIAFALEWPLNKVNRISKQYPDLVTEFHRQLTTPLEDPP